jgi:hypothetical protein
VKFGGVPIDNVTENKRIQQGENLVNSSQQQGKQYQVPVLL